MSPKRALLAFSLFTSVTLFSTAAAADCWIAGYDTNGTEVVECSNGTEPLPICGSQFDTGGRCVTQGQGAGVGSNPNSGGRGGTINYGDTGTATGQTPFNAAGPSPSRGSGAGIVNGGSNTAWPNRAQQLANGK